MLVVSGSLHQQDHASHQLPSDPIAAFANSDRGVREQQQYQTASSRPRKAKVVRQKVKGQFKKAAQSG